ncbi:MAG: AAA family ATPase, partial [Muribaculaceae bacterium]|nr:AAA family ATPase [Muribaculaceae bacterium]
MKNDFSKQFLPILTQAGQVAREFNSQAIRAEHFVLVALRNKDGYAFKILSQLNVPIDKMIQELSEYLREGNSDEQTTTLFEQQFKITLSAIRHLQLATSEARKMKAPVIGGEHIILALMHDNRSMDSEFLRHLKENYLNFDITIQNIGGDGEAASPMSAKSFDEDEEEDDDNAIFGKASAETSKSGSKTKSATPALDKFGYDMTAAAAEGRLDPVVGREREIERLAQILSRRKKNNPVLIGEPGVGKSAIVEGLALRIVQKKVSRILFNKRVIGLDLAGMVAGTKYRGQFE